MLGSDSSVWLKNVQDVRQTAEKEDETRPEGIVRA
jgi:hypothetical protein